MPLLLINAFNVDSSDDFELRTFDHWWGADHISASLAAVISRTCPLSAIEIKNNSLKLVGKVLSEFG